MYEMFLNDWITPDLVQLLKRAQRWQANRFYYEANQTFVFTKNNS